MQKRIVIERLEHKFEILKAKRDAAKLVLREIQDEMTPMGLKLRGLKKEEKDEELQKKRIARLDSFRGNEVSEGSVLNIDPITRSLLESDIFGYRCDNDADLIYMGLIRRWFIERRCSEPLRDVDREVYIVNEIAKGAQYNALGRKLKITGQRVKAIYMEVIKNLRYTKIGRKIRKDRNE